MPSRASPWLFAIVCASAALDAWQIDWGLPSDYGWAPDELVPSAVLAGAAQGFSRGWYEKYPPFHYALLAIAYVPVAAASRAAGLSPAQLMHALFLAGRALSAVMAVGSVLLVYRSSRVAQDEAASVLAAGLAAFTPTFVYYAKVANLDAPYVFWFCLSLLFYVRALAHPRRRDCVGFAMAAAAAIATKDQAYGLYLGAVPFLFWKLRARRRDLLAAAAAGVLTLLVLDNALLNPIGLRAHLELAAGPASRSFRVFPADARGELLLALDALSQLRFVLGWPALLACAAGLAWAARERASLLLATLVPIASYLIGFVGVVLYVYDRFLLPVAVVMALFGGFFLSRLIQRSRAAGLAAAIAVLGWGAVRAASVDVLMAADGRYDVEKRLRQEASGRLVAAAGPLEYLPRLEGLRWHRLGPSLRRLAEMKPDFVVVNADYARRADPGTGERQLYDALDSGSAGYVLEFSHRTRTRLSVLRDEDWSPERPLPILTNLDKIDPEIRVYRRRE